MPSDRPRRPLPLLLAVCALVTAPAILTAGGAEASPKAKSGVGRKDDAGARAAPAKSAPSHPGWIVDRLRVEPLDQDGWVALAGRGDYRGSLELVPDGTGVAVLNDVGFEDYMRGIAEVPASWPAEAQRAQAIAARTYALFEMLRPAAATASRAVGAHLCATEACQVYAGLAKERRSGGQAWAAAVEATRAQVLLYKGGPILAKYSSSNGGRSVPGGYPYLRPVDDPDDARSPHHRWRVTYSYADLGAALALSGTVTSVQRAGDLVALDWSAPGVQGTTEIHVLDFRAKLNAALPAPLGLARPLPSVNFSVNNDPSAGTAILDGRGFGHGIGMSQFGALGKALRGMRAADILASYYGGIRPTALRPEQLPARVKVALALGLPAAEIGASSRFRISDASGATVAVAASGAWRVTPAGTGRLRVHAPPDQGGTPKASGLALAPALPRPGGGVELRFALSAPASVAVTVTDLDGAPMASRAPRLLGVGEAVVDLVAPRRVGAYRMEVVADAGGGRLTRVSAPMYVLPASTTAADLLAPVVPGSGGGRPRPVVTFAALLATMLLVMLLRRLIPAATSTLARPSLPRRSKARQIN